MKVIAGYNEMLLDAYRRGEMTAFLPSKFSESMYFANTGVQKNQSPESPNNFSNSHTSFHSHIDRNIRRSPVVFEERSTAALTG